ncbi:MAG TPA: aryl-sulfate sulfotransferase [Polyangiaceae bacterium]
MTPDSGLNGAVSASGTAADGGRSGGGGGLFVGGAGLGGATAHPMGGASSGAGTSAAGSGGNGVAGAATADCTFTLRSEVSPVIGTVGIVEWSSGLLGIDSAAIEFGLDRNYGMTAPVDLTEPNYRTLLLGMKPSRTYHFRVVARNAQSTCMSDDFTLTTGPLPSGLPTIAVSTFHPERLAGGFLITGQYVTSIDTRPPAYILDADGELVWWYMAETTVTGACMSHDGKSMWINAANPPDLPTTVHRVSMDGLIDEDLSHEFVGQNHQLTVLPDETVAFYAYGANDCDDVKLRYPDGSVRTLMNASEVPNGGDCHLNTIQYSPLDDTLVFSDLYRWSYTKITRDGEIVWILGGAASHFTGDGASWDNQHGVDVLGLDRLLIFNNGSPGGESLAIEIFLDLGARTATRVWSYAAEPPIYNAVMGDIQRAANGNTIVSYSTQGVLHEVGPDGTLLRELNWGPRGTFGYVHHRASLYGPPDR